MLQQILTQLERAALVPHQECPSFFDEAIFEKLWEGLLEQVAPSTADCALWTLCFKVQHTTVSLKFPFIEFEQWDVLNPEWLYHWFILCWPDKSSPPEGKMHFTRRNNSMYIHSGHWASLSQLLIHWTGISMKHFLKNCLTHDEIWVIQRQWKNCQWGSISAMGLLIPDDSLLRSALFSKNFLTT